MSMKKIILLLSVVATILSCADEKVDLASFINDSEARIFQFTGARRP